MHSEEENEEKIQSGSVLPHMGSPRIVFMGTPEFAVASLDAMVKAGCHIAGVVTAPDKPAGRGMRLSESPVKVYATANGLNVLQPEKLKDPAFLEALRGLRADVQVVVAFRMLPEVVWSMPPMGTINVHASLLPKYRGAAPINWAIIQGENETGVTTFKLTHEIDTGNILLQKKVAIAPDETAGELHDKLMHDGAELLLKTLEGLVSGTISEQPQHTFTGVSHAPKIFTDTCRIDWNKPAAAIHNLIRGLSPYPAAFTDLQGKKIKIFRSEVISQAPAGEPGSIQTDNKTYLWFAAQDGYLGVKELQAEGRKKLSVAEFLKGFRNIS